MECEIQKLTVLYDQKCALCQRARQWLAGQPVYIPLEFVPLQTPLLERRFPGVGAFRPEDEIIVLDDVGGVYRGGAAWVMSLWATQTFREWSLRMSHPKLFPLVRRFCTLVSHHRLSLSQWLPRSDPRQLHDAILAESLPCTDGSCQG